MLRSNRVRQANEDACAQIERLRRPPDLQRFFVDVLFANVFTSLSNQERRARRLVD
jgi:hypothetical protein